MDGFRTLVRGWLGKVLMVILALPFVLFGVESYFKGSASSDIAATVDKKEISRRELEQRVGDQRKALLAKVGNNADLIDETVLLTPFARDVEVDLDLLRLVRPLLALLRHRDRDEGLADAAPITDLARRTLRTDHVVAVRLLVGRVQDVVIDRRRHLFRSPLSPLPFLH